MSILTSGFFNPWMIVRDHVRTLRQVGPMHRWDRWGLFVFFGVPIAVASLLIVRGVSLSDDMVSILITSMSIFAALLFNLLLLVYDVVQKAGPARRAQTNQDEERVEWIRCEYLRQIFKNISFAIFAAILVVVLLLLHLLLSDSPGGALDLALTTLIYFFTTIFLLTLVMVLKRVHILLTNEFGVAAPPVR